MTKKVKKLLICYSKGKRLEIFAVDKKQIEQAIAELKMEYINLQGDIEKLESVGQNRMVTKSEERLGKMEERLSELNEKLAQFN